MKNIEKIKGLMMLIMAVASAVLSGGLAMAAVTIPDPGTDNDPNEGTPAQNSVKTTPLDKGGDWQPGEGASYSNLDQKEMIDKKLRKKVLEYHASQYPFYTKFLQHAEFIDVSGKKEVTYPVIGDPVLEAVTKSAISNSTTKAERVELPLYDMDKNIFPEKYTATVWGVAGYGPDGQEDGSQLMLFVTKKEDGENPTVMAVNGPINTTTGKTYVPDIPAGTKVTRAAAALAEEEVELTPLNITPEWESAYLQKKGYAVSVSDMFEEADTEADWGTSNIRRQALDIFKRDCTITLLFGAKAKWIKQTKRGPRYNFTQEGVTHQIRNGYQLNGRMTYQDLINIAELAFLDYSDSDEMDLYCGPGFIRQVLNIDYENRTPLVYANDKDLKVDIASFTCSFGKLNFILERAFRYVHLNNSAIGIMMGGAKRICREKGKTYKKDGKKQGSEVEEATDWFYVQDDCCVIDTLNSIIIAPSSVFEDNKYTDGVTHSFKSVSELPTTGLTAGTTVSLTAWDGDYAPGFYKYNGTGWVVWNGDFEI